MFCRTRADLSKQALAQGFAGWGGKLRVSVAVLQLYPEQSWAMGPGWLSLCSAAPKAVL